jgi:hypothetical protein
LRGVSKDGRMLRACHPSRLAQADGAKHRQARTSSDNGKAVAQGISAMQRQMRRGDAVRAGTKFLNRINAILPVQSPLQKYFGFRTPQITSRTLGIPPHKRGVGHRHERGEGCGGRGSVLRATGSQGRLRPVSDQQHADERCCSVRRSRVVLTPRRWRQVRGCCVGPTGRGYNVGSRATVAKEPGHRGEREGTR